MKTIQRTLPLILFWIIGTSLIGQKGSNNYVIYGSITVIHNVETDITGVFDTDSETIRIRDYETGELIIIDENELPEEHAAMGVDIMEDLVSGETLDIDTSLPGVTVHGENKKSKETRWQRILRFFGLRKRGGENVMAGCVPSEMEDWLNGKKPDWGPIILISPGKGPISIEDTDAFIESYREMRR